MEQVRPAGTVVMVGIADDPDPDHPRRPGDQGDHPARGAGVHLRDFQESIRLLSGGRGPVDALVTGIFGLDRADELFDELLRPETEHLKIMLDPAA